jgi:biopolymer transport protein ExbB
MQIFQLLMAGGIVMIPLLVFSIIAIALIVERSIFWFRIYRRQKRVVRDVLNLYSSHSLEAAIHRLKQNIDLPIARIFLEGLDLKGASTEKFRLALESAAQAEIPILKRFNNVFDMIISLSPLLGLLGTVLGLIRSFASLNLGDIGGSNTLNVTSGISEALVSTAYGLMVAIFTLFFASAFRGLYQRQIALIQEYAGRLELFHQAQLEESEVEYASTR